MIKSPKLPDATHLNRSGLGAVVRVAIEQNREPGIRHRILRRRPVEGGRRH